MSTSGSSDEDSSKKGDAEQKFSLETGDALGQRMDVPQGLTLPDDFESNRGRYEIWSIRVPVDFDPEEMLHKKDLVFTGKQDGASTKLSCMLPDNSSDNDGSAVKNQAIVEGESSESCDMRIMTKDTSKITSGDDEDDDALPEFKPTLKFDRNFHLISDSELVENLLVKNNLKLETELAPSIEKVQEKLLQTKGFKWRVPYVPVAQVQNLKRKWTPPGSESAKAKAGVVAPAVKSQEKPKTTNKRSRTKEKKSKHKHKEKKHKK